MPLLEEDPDIRRLVPFDRKDWGRLANWRRVLGEIATLRRERYDLILDLQGLARTALVGRLCRGRRFVGVHDWREFAPLLQGESVPRPSAQTHAADWYLEVARHLGIRMDRPYEWLPARPSGRLQIQRQFPELESGNWIGFQPGARWENKRWPLDSFRQLSRLLEQRLPDHRIAVFGGPDETGLGQAIAGPTGGRILDLTGRMTLPGMIEGIRRMRLLVTNDTGPMHVAAAVGCPVVALFGPTAAERTGPYSQLGNVLRIEGLQCAPCMKSTCRNPEPLACLNRISPTRVADKVVERLRA